jgi:hypothetical protein
MPAFSIVIKTDTDLTVNADFTAAASCPRLSVNIKAFRGDRVGPGQDIAYRWQEWDLRCTERALAHSVILAAQISEVTRSTNEQRQSVLDSTSAASRLALPGRPRRW